MKLGIGIDTGGTYTDAVIYDFEKKSVLSFAKALTTKEDLCVGILNALDGLEDKFFADVSIVSLSTTLATNACVENKGGRAKLIFYGIDKRAYDKVGKSYGLGNQNDICFFDKDEKEIIINEKNLLEETSEWLSDADGLGIVESFAMKNGAKYEKAAKRIFEKKYGFPVICGHELFSELNSIQRGSTTLLNAKLVPIIKDFISAIKIAMEKRNIDAPIVIVRSDSSLMSEEYSKIRPVETILCGPAASILGGMKLSDEKESIIIDMGGTTTDISLVKNGLPMRVSNGISIGKWRTFVNGVFIDTFGLGGDSRIRIVNGEIKLDAKRVVPLCVAAKKWPQINQQLEELAQSRKGHTYPLHEFFSLVKDISQSENYYDDEKKFCELLKDGPIMIEQAAKDMGKDVYSFNMKRLEKEGIVIRCGLTPTDIMHLKGDFAGFDKNASKNAALFAVICMCKDNSISLDEFCDMVYDKIKCKLYCNIVRILIYEKYPEFVKDGLTPQLKRMIKDSWEMSKSGERKYTDFGFGTKAALISIGAPTHIFIKDVAKALGTKAVIPKFAGVANAVGAIFGKVRAFSTIEIKAEYGGSGFEGYIIYGKERNYRTDDIEEAKKIAADEAKKDAVKEAKRRGAMGDISVEISVDAKMGKIWGDVDIDLGTRVTAVANGEFSA